MTSFEGMGLTFEPLYEWPGKRTHSPSSSPFTAPWSTTLDLLQKELTAIRARGVVLQAFLAPARVRNDGLPYANATPSLPGVILSITESKQGRLRFPCDTFSFWQDNIRAIALSMEALRRVDRYGVTKGAQYKGLPGPGATAGSITATTAAARIVDLATHIEEAPRARDILEERVHAARIIRMLTKELHPDIHPERSRDWHLFVEAKHTLERHHGSR